MFKTSTKKKPAVGATRAMVAESLERREMFAVGGYIVSAGPGSGPHVTVQTAPTVYVDYKSTLGVVVGVVDKYEPPPSP